ncbi:MAG: DUF2069 domain-containing protein, partial [Pseudomonadota bacterium]|nr:DUF2069 domain-containing protein [Pseudomonadota bacterium]
MLIRRLHLIAITSLVGLIILSLAWGGTLVSFRPDGYWSILKSLPLMLVFPGILKGRIYTCQYSSLLILAYLTEGIVRSLTSQGLSAHLAAVEIL